jgi:hypothetical protein
MKTIKVLIMILLAAGMGSQGTSAQEQETHKLTIPLSNPGEPGMLECSLISGSITVTGYNGEVVIIEATPRTIKVEKDADREKDEEVREGTEGLRRITSPPSFTISAEENDNTVEISSDSWRQGIDLVIQVPVNFSLHIGTVNNGDITAEGVSGNHEVRNVNGPITLNNVSGSVLANTVNQDITVVFESVEDGTPMSFSSMNGDIDITLPGSVRATAKMRSNNGDIYTDFNMEIEQKRVKKEDSEEAGIYKISVEDWTYGKINGGGPEYTLKGFNGDIFLRKK